jgi:hypothetical protein
MRTPVMARAREPVDEPPAPLPVRSPSERRRRDCVFIPDMDIALQFIEARRRASEFERDTELVRQRTMLAREGGMETPIAIGLLMTIAPPLAVTLVWSSPRFPRAAQIALTIYGALVTLVIAALVLSVLG